MEAPRLTGSSTDEGSATGTPTTVLSRLIAAGLIALVALGRFIRRLGWLVGRLLGRMLAPVGRAAIRAADGLLDVVEHWGRALINHVLVLAPTARSWSRRAAAPVARCGRVLVAAASMRAPKSGLGGPGWSRCDEAGPADRRRGDVARRFRGWRNLAGAIGSRRAPSPESSRPPLAPPVGWRPSAAEKADSVAEAVIAAASRRPKLVIVGGSTVLAIAAACLAVAAPEVAGVVALVVAVLVLVGAVGMVGVAGAALILLGLVVALRGCCRFLGATMAAAARRVAFTVGIASLRARAQVRARRSPAPAPPPVETGYRRPPDPIFNIVVSQNEYLAPGCREVHAVLTIASVGSPPGARRRGTGARRGDPAGLLRLHGEAVGEASGRSTRHCCGPRRAGRWDVVRRGPR